MLKFDACTRQSLLLQFGSFIRRRLVQLRFLSYTFWHLETVAHSTTLILDLAFPPAFHSLVLRLLSTARSACSHLTKALKNPLPLALLMAYLGSLPRPARKQYLLAVFALVLISVYLFLPTVQQRSHLSRLVLSQKLSSWTQRQQKYALEGPLQELPPGRPYDLPSIQHKFARETAEATQLRESRLQAIKDSFSHSWNGYRKHAWLNDELSPMSGGAKNTFGNWSATLVDSLDSLWIMGFYDEFEEAVQAVAGIDFETSTSKIVSVFETTIRYLGGLLSAYDLSGNNILLEKAWNLGNMLYAAFDTPSRMPVPYWDWKK